VFVLTNKQLTDKLRDLEDFLLEDYKQKSVEKERDWPAYERELMHRIRLAIKNLEPLLNEACAFDTATTAGRPHALTVKQRLTLLLLQRLMMKSNRLMANMLDVFSLLTGIDVSYKSIERLYSDEEVRTAVDNLHVLTLKNKGVTLADACGDGTGYALTISRHYATETKKRGDDAKDNETALKEPETQEPAPNVKTSGVKKPKTRKAFAYVFRLIDLRTRLYIAYGTSLKSEKQAYDAAMRMLAKRDVNLNSVRLDKYYSASAFVSQFGLARVFVIPKSNATIRGSMKWKHTLADFIHNTDEYLHEYYKRQNIESSHSADKRWLGWNVSQRLDERINLAVGSISVWHNLLNLHPTQ
jgi:transposase